MKKGFFGYKVSEVDVVINALREENESLNATITTLKTQIKNSAADNGAKANLLEADLKKNEEILKQVTEDKNELISQISSLTLESDLLNQQNTELISQMEHLHRQNEDLNRQISEYRMQIMELTAQVGNADTSVVYSLKSRVDGEKEYKTAVEQAFKVKKQILTAATSDLEEDDQRGTFTDEYIRMKEELEHTKAALGSVTNELEKAHKDIGQLRDELAIAQLAVDEQAKMKAIEKKQFADLNQASRISYQAYYDMSRMRNEVVEFLHEQIKEYYQFVNENSIKMRTAIEKRQSEYNQMIREFFTRASEFRANLSNIDAEYSNLADYNMNIDKISHRMNEIMDSFIEESTVNLKIREEALKPWEDHAAPEKDTGNTEEVSKKPIFKIS